MKYTVDATLRILNGIPAEDIHYLASIMGLNLSHYKTPNMQAAGIAVKLHDNFGLSDKERAKVNKQMARKAARR